MDILNFISWIRGKRQVTSVDPTKTLIPVGLKDGRRDDDYLTGAISVADFASQVASQQSYKVYTALLTQSGGNESVGLTGGTLIIGVSYRIINPVPGDDFRNVGAPDNNAGTYFCATGEDPINWTNGTLIVPMEGAPIVTVFENTIGNIWFTYENAGEYVINSNDLFTENKTWIYPNNTQSIPTDGGSFISLYSNDSSSIILKTSDNNIISFGNNPLRLEIRVYD
jgi:hypothetical protein